MKPTIDLGVIQINAADLIESLDGAGRAYIISLLGCSERVIWDVACQIVEGITEEGHHGYMTHGALPVTPLDRARAYLAKNASRAAREHIERLEQLCIRAESDRREVANKLQAAQMVIVDLRARLDSDDYSPSAGA